MFRSVLVLALSGAVVACATPQATTAEKECVTETEDATGTRLETSTVCQPAGD